MKAKAAHIRHGVAVVSALLLVSCAGTSGRRGDGPTIAPTTRATVPVPGSNPAYAHDGPHVVSIVTLQTASTAIEVLYPALPGSEKGKPRATYDLRAALRDPKLPALKPDPSQLVSLPAYRDLPPATGRFPVVLFSHAYGAVPLQSSTLEIDIAAWGFVVIAPDHIERDTLAVAQGRASVNDVRDALALRSAMDVVATTPELGAMLDTTHIAAVGHAQGGATAIASLAVTDVDTAVAWASVAPVGALAGGAGKPVMLIGAQRDFEDGSKVQNGIYARLTGPKRLVLLGGGAGHATFVDECLTLRSSGLLPLGGGVRTGDRLADLAQNGCHPDEVDPLVAWPVILHFTVAHLRDVFGIDRPPVGMGDAIASAFPKLPLTYEHRP
jgi:dienelactone hydrolase